MNVLKRIKIELFGLFVVLPIGLVLLVTWVPLVCMAEQYQKWKSHAT